ncbi:hypothetical protein VARIO8X_50428 [Burkholderiales bacterium 8X]|nr:hypothetical protein VARIO8X_50428 [Burkholderiales bacterium 8X]
MLSDQHRFDQHRQRFLYRGVAGPHSDLGRGLGLDQRGDRDRGGAGGGVRRALHAVRPRGVRDRRQRAFGAPDGFAGALDPDRRLHAFGLLLGARRRDLHLLHALRLRPACGRAGAGRDRGRGHRRHLAHRRRRLRGRHALRRADARHHPDADFVRRQPELVVDPHRGGRAALRLLPAATLLRCARAAALSGSVHFFKTLQPGIPHAGCPFQETALHRMVRNQRQERLHVSQLDEEPGHPGPRVRRPPDHRHLQHLVGADAVQCALSEDRRAREARRLRGGRLSGGVPGVLERRIEPAADRDADPQPGQHGRGGSHPRQPDRCGGAAHRLRQDDAGPADGRRELRHPRDRGHRRADAQRQARGPRHRLGHGRMAAARILQGRRDRPASVPVGRGRHVPVRRHLQHHGHRLDDGLHGGGIGHIATAQRRHPGGRCEALRSGADVGRPRGRDGARGARPLEDPDPRSLRERDPGQRGDRRIDQCGDPPEGDRRPHRRSAGAGGLGAARPRHADHRRPDAFRPLPDGGVLLRRRPARGAAPARGAWPAAASRRAHRQRPLALGQRARRTELQRRGDPADRQAADRGRRHPRAARQPGAAGCGAQALGGDARAAQAPRPRRRVREPGALQGTHRRRVARGRRRFDPGDEELRTEGLPGHGRGRQHGAAAQAAAPGREGHGPHLGCPHERHRLRHGGAARGARSGRRRSACRGARWRLDRARLRGGSPAPRHS